MGKPLLNSSFCLHSCLQHVSCSKTQIFPLYFKKRETWLRMGSDPILSEHCVEDCYYSRSAAARRGVG